MASEEKEDHSSHVTLTNSDDYPLDSSCYKILEEIGKGVGAIVYKAICIPMDSSVVAIKAIDLEQTKADFEHVRQEAKTMTLLCHPNLLNAHCFFTVDSSLWVVMPFMSGGSLQSIIASSFPDGLPEACIAAVLKEILNALSYLHSQGHLHRDIKAGNILIDSNGSVKLADFGVSASIYEHNLSSGLAGSSSSSSQLLTDVTGTPYWMAPEVIPLHAGYSFKADIWSFGITALEVAHGRPPLSHLPLSKSLMTKIMQRFWFPYHYVKTKDSMNKKFSTAFKDMVGLCLDNDPSKRPAADELLKHSFFKNCEGFLVENVLQGLPAVEQRLKDEKIHRFPSFEDEEDDDDAWNVRQRRISGWNFNEEVFELEPVFPSDPIEAGGDHTVGKRVTFGGETLIQEKVNKGFDEKGATSSGGVDNLNESTKQALLRSMQFIRGTLDDQKKRVGYIIASVGGPNRVEQLMHEICNVNKELETERRKTLDVEDMELEPELLKLAQPDEL